jgi:hypothetical protein
MNHIDLDRHASPRTVASLIEDLNEGDDSAALVEALTLFLALDDADALRAMLPQAVYDDLITRSEWHTALSYELADRFRSLADAIEDNPDVFSGLATLEAALADAVAVFNRVVETVPS